MGLPSLQTLSGGGGLCFCHTFFTGGGLENYPGGGVGLRGLGGCSFFASQVVFCWSLLVLMRKCNFEIAGMPCNAVKCCGVLLSRKV